MTTTLDLKDVATERDLQMLRHSFLNGLAPFGAEDEGGYGTDTFAFHDGGAIWLSETLPDGHLHVIEGTGHFAPRTHPVEYADFVRATAALAGA